MSLVATVLVLQVVAQSFAIVMSRYRLVIVPMLMIPAGLAVATGLQWMLARRWRAVAAWSGGLSLLCVMWWAWPAEARMLVGAVRPVDFAIGAASLAQHDDKAGAWAELEQRIRYNRAHAVLSPGEAGHAELLLRRDRLLMYVRRGRFAEVQQDWDVLRQAVGSEDPAIQEVLRFLEQGNKGSQ
jgi:hypothetical protein